MDTYERLGEEACDQVTRTTCDREVPHRALPLGARKRMVGNRPLQLRWWSHSPELQIQSHICQQVDVDGMLFCGIG